MKMADAKNDTALSTKATLRPATTVARPPTEAPMASIPDHKALESALAGSSSSADVMFGMVAVRAGSKNAEAETITAVTTYAIHTWSGRRISSEPEHHDAAQQVRGDHQRAPVDAIDDDARHRTDDGERQELHDHHPRDGRRGPGQVEQQRVDGNGAEPVAELRDRLADEEQPVISVRPEQCEVGIQCRSCPLVSATWPRVTETRSWARRCSVRLRTELS